LSRRLFSRGPCLLLGLALLASCATAGKAPPAPSAARGASSYPHAFFAVISDPHVYDPSLGTSGPAFEAATAGARVLYGHSAELFHEAVSEAIELGPDFVLLPGDLTKDGELASHALVLGELGRLEEAGIRAYVIPGNHDIDNPRARSFSGASSTALPSPSMEEFARLYERFGYGDDVARDPGSLSYVAQLLPGLRLLALDPFEYPRVPDPRNPEPAADYSPATMAWIRAALEDAETSGDAVVAMAHMSLLEHFEGQSEYFPESFPRGSPELAALLASHNVRLAFTGHFHIQDVSLKSFPGGEDFYDIATASTAGYPMAYRVVELGGASLDGRLPENEASIRSVFIESVPSVPEGLQDLAKVFLEGRVSTIIERKLESFFVPKGEAGLIARRYAEAYIALCRGDESPAPGDDVFPPGIRSLGGRLAAERYAGLLKSLWRDLPPADNDLRIDLGVIGKSP
jgi:hypothetical protein